MKILKISVDGLMLFNDKVSIDFFAEQRVIKDNSDMLLNVFKNVYTNNVISVVGINASGKTSVLKLISFALELINGQSLNNIVNRDVLTDSKKVNIEVIFYDDNNILYKLQSEIISVRNNEIDNRFIFGAEKIWKKSISKIHSKKDIVSYENTNLFKERDNTAEFLSDDVSIAIAISKNNKIFVRDLLNYTNMNMNMLRLIENYPHELIKFLDPSIESIIFDKNNSEIRLKFYGKDAISLSNPLQCEKYLSSGTIKGLNVFLNAMMVFNKGGYLLVDELENHLNREIVVTLYRFFTNPIVNKMGATIIFTTHYSELLDEFERSDNIYIVRNKNGISAEKLCNLLKRNDIKKSEAFKSGYLEGTAPLYESYIDLKEVIINSRIELGVH